MVYSPDRKLLIACSRSKEGWKKPYGRTVHYDIEKDKWLPAASGPGTPLGFSSFTSCGYDTVAKLMLLYDQKSKVFWGYDPGEKKWFKISPKGPPPPWGRGKIIGYYDEARNVFVLNQNSKVWAYRHKLREK
jgi:hypothetical protein